MKKMAVTWVDKNESFFKRTHKTKQNISKRGHRKGLIPHHEQLSSYQSYQLR